MDKNTKILSAIIGVYAATLVIVGVITVAANGHYWNVVHGADASAPTAQTALNR